ncbi:MAG: ferritin family protein [Candidatus Aminicenantes bacterium]|nr:ferritin family protein [Candidatus Aminicenantes bacterium]
MENVSHQVLDGIKGAIRLEINGRKFFNHAADVTHNERGQKMFRFLAAEEVNHLETFGKLFSKVLKSEDWKNYVKNEEIKGEAPLVEKLKERMKGEAGKSEVEALSIGMELEKEAIQFFQESAKASDDPEAKKIFLEIVEEEKFHYDLLQSQYDSVMHNGIWLGGAEFQMDGKW